MKLITATFMLATTASFVSAWHLDLYGADGRHITMHGHLDSGCKTIDFTPALNVNRAKFDASTPIVSDPGTFELYVNAGCKGLSYRNDPGDWPLTPARQIRSYKVY